MTVNLTQYFDPGLLYVFLVFVISAAVCDVCGPGHYGGNCSNVCPSECKDGLCRPRGLCEDCRDGLYGMTCSQSCPSTCPDNLCHRFNVSCKKECREGMYGKKCDKHCSRCPGPCNWRTGECIGNSSEKTDLSPLDRHSPSESLASEDSHIDPTLPLAIGVPVAILLVAVLVWLIQRKRLRASNPCAAHRKNAAEQSDVSSEPLL